MREGERGGRNGEGGGGQIEKKAFRGREETGRFTQ